MAKVLSINEFQDTPHLRDVLRTLGNKDDVIEAREVDENDDGAIDFNPILYTHLTTSEFSTLQARLFGNGTLRVERDRTELKYFFERVAPFLKDIADKAIHDKRPKEDVDAFISQISKYSPPKNDKEFKEYKSNVVFLYRCSGKHLGFMAELIGTLDLDLKRCTKNDFAKEFATKLNAYIATNERPDRKLLRKVSKIINQVHDYDLHANSSDNMRKKICRLLAPRSAYLMIALGGDHLYPTSLITLWKVQDIKRVREWIKAIDPQEAYVCEFVKQLCTRGLTELLKDDKEYFLKVARDIIFKSDDYMEDIAHVISLYDTFLPEATEAERGVFAELLLKDYQNGDIEKERKWCLAFLIKYYGSKFNLGSVLPTLQPIIDGLPEIKIPSIPRNDWLADNTLTAELYFYDDPAWLRYTVNFYRGKKWTVEPSSNDNNVVFAKQVNGVDLRVILKHRKDDFVVTEDGDGKWDIRVHRSHYHTVVNTFPKINQTFTQKLLVDASCGSLGNVVLPSFRRNYSGNQYAADINTAEGKVNTAFLYKFMNEVALGETSWQAFDAFKKDGLRLPNHQALLVYDYVRQNSN